MTIRRERRRIVSTFATALVSLCIASSCSDDATTQPPETSSPSASTASPAPSAREGGQSNAEEFEVWLRRKLTLPGLPSFAVPLDVFADRRDQELAAQLDIPPGLYAGIAVVDARCKDGVEVAADASGVTRQADGSGRFSGDGVSIVVQGDGSGSFDDGSTSIVIQSDGSGSYANGAVSLEIQGDGSGTYDDGVREVDVDGDRSGRYADPEIQVEVSANGSARYVDHDGTVVVSANGTFTTTGKEPHADVVARVLADGLPLFPPVPRIGELPEPAPGLSCGTVIRLDANVLFDFDRDSLRPEAASLLDRVGALLVALGSPPLRVDGHTDAVGTEAYNLDLSQRRADAVRAALVDRSVAAGSIQARGLGESVPLVPEMTPDGRDDPAARQRNRRVELVLLDG
jgi:OOP family OmpA-OmpF porin